MAIPMLLCRALSGSLSAMPGTARPDTATRPAGNVAFAKRAAGFVNRAPGFPLLWIACAAAAALMIVTGGFGTGDLPFARRTGFWLLLMGWNGLKWQLLFAAFVESLGWTGVDTLSNVAYDPAKKQLTAFEKGRGAGDCGTVGAWEWGGAAFRMVEYRAKEECDGVGEPGKFPIIFRGDR